MNVATFNDNDNDNDDDDDEVIVMKQMTTLDDSYENNVENDNNINTDTDTDIDLIPDNYTIPYYLQDAFSDLMMEDGLLCLGKGLQYLHLLAILCKYYSTTTTTTNIDNTTTSSSSTTTTVATSISNTKEKTRQGPRSRRRRPLVFVLGLKDEKERSTLIQILHSWENTTTTTKNSSSSTVLLPPIITMITNECGQSKDRQKIYEQGGIIGITSRILIVDLLSNIVTASSIHGLLIVHAHTVTMQSTEAFIIRIYKSYYYSNNSSNNNSRNNNNDSIHNNNNDDGGFVKAITDNADACISGGFGHVDKLLKALQVRKLYLYPRFHDSIRNELECCLTTTTTTTTSTSSSTISNINPILVIEYHQELSSRQKDIQSSIAVLVMQCLRQLKQQTDHLVQWSSSGSVGSNSNDNNNNNNASNDGSTSILSVENCVTQQFDSIISKQLEPYWYKLAPSTKQLVQDLRTLKTLFIYLLQYDCITFYKLLCSIRTISAASRFPSMWLLEPATDILFRKAKERVYTIYHPPPTSTTSTKLSKDKQQQDVSHLITTLEENPKWKLLKTVLEEIHQDYNERLINKKYNHKGVTNVLVMVKDDKVLETIRSYLADNDTTSQEQKNDINDATNIKMSTVSPLPPKTLLLKWLRYLQHVNDKSRNITDARGSTDSLSEESRLLLEEEGRMRRILFGTTNTTTNSNKRNVESKLSTKSSGKKRSLSSSNDIKEPSGNENSNKSKGLNQIPSYVRQRRRIAVEKGRGKTTADDIHRRALLEEAIDRTENEMSTTRTNKTNKTNKSPNKKASSATIQSPGKRIEDDTVLNDVNENCKDSLDVYNDGVAKPTLGSYDDDDDDDDDEKMFHVSYADNELRVVLNCYSMVEGDQSHLLLQDIRPKYVVFYDTDVAFIRAVEVYAALAAAEAADAASTSNIREDDDYAGKPVAPIFDPIRAYFLMFEASAEEKNYKRSLEREQNAFERLIHHKMTMSAPVLQSMETQEMQEALKHSSSVAGTYMDGRYPLSIDTRRGKGKLNTSKERRDIAVDVREFRSALPNILHQGGMRLAPVTLTVGDFVLSNVHCIERKSISDLFGSFASGRLYTQVEAMSKYYACPCLLIEFDPNKTFCLQNANELGVDIRIDSVCSKIVLLVSHFPKLRILWSRSPQNTLNIFRDLKVNHEEVDVERAIEIGRNESEEYLLQPDDRDGEEDEINEAARDMLLRLPGVNVQAARRIMQECDTLAELCQMSREDLRRIVGPVNGQKLFTFFRQNIGAT